jgi:hypothetical protein
MVDIPLAPRTGKVGPMSGNHTLMLQRVRKKDRDNPEPLGTEHRAPLPDMGTRLN